MTHYTNGITQIMESQSQIYSHKTVPHTCSFSDTSFVSKFHIKLCEPPIYMTTIDVFYIMKIIFIISKLVYKKYEESLRTNM